MSSTTVLLDNGPLAEVDLVALGAASGMLWRSPEITVVGIGPAEHIPLRLGTSVEAVTAHLHDLSGTDDVGRAGTGPVGFVTLPFDRDADGLVLVPSVVLGESGGIRFATALDGRSIDSIGTEVDALLSEPISSRPTEVTVHLGRTAEAWRDDVVAIARDRIASSELQKAVLARELVLKANADFSLARIVASLAERFAEAMVFSIDGFVGASPELLVSRIDRIVRAHPLAGTAARSTDPDVDAQQIASLHASAKDRVEHQITIDWLLTELLPFCSYVDAEPEPSTLTLANVHHLGTLVEGVLSEPAASILDLVDAVHPTPGSRRARRKLMRSNSSRSSKVSTGVAMAVPRAGLIRRGTDSSPCRSEPRRFARITPRSRLGSGWWRKAIHKPNSRRHKQSSERCSGRSSVPNRSQNDGRRPVVSRRARPRGHRCDAILR